MHNLSPLEQGSLKMLKKIFKAKSKPRKEILKGLKSRVVSHSGKYLCLIKSPVQKSQMRSTAEEREALIHCYESETGALNSLKKAIADHHTQHCLKPASLCPFCGINTPDANELDHYLPKEKFPAYSVYSKNLVPTCGKCNKLKGTKWANAKIGRRIYSNYYDPLPERQFLSVDITLERDLPKGIFTLSEDKADYSGLFELVTSHFKELRLLARFAKAFPIVLDEAVDGLLSFDEPLDRDHASRWLTKRAGKLSENFGLNHWKAVLFLAFVESEVFWEYLGDQQ
jgi:5-methylcytosine-specific restriction endonuclease McrA